MPTPLHFKNAAFYLQGSGTEAVPISEAMEVELNVDFEVDDAPAFGDTWMSSLKGILKFTGSFGANYDTAQGGNAVWEAAVASTSRKMYLYPDIGTATNYYYGNIFPKLGLQGSVDAKGTTSNSFDGDGALSLKP